MIPYVLLKKTARVTESYEPGHYTGPYPDLRELLRMHHVRHPRVP